VPTSDANDAATNAHPACGNVVPLPPAGPASEGLGVHVDQNPSPLHTHAGVQNPREQQPDRHCESLVHDAEHAHTSPPQLAIVATSEPVHADDPEPVPGGAAHVPNVVQL
jgi:hypothetical protein